jgi:DNA repair exonuclease SbcCD ATPase subunit
MIRFSKVKWKNFLSTGAQFTEVKLDKATTTLIVGENGAGKSTILDAICFCLFNKPFRSINKPQLMNSINGKNLLVELEFSIGPKNYKIIRGIKPGIFEIYVNDILLNQDAASKDYQKYLEDGILKLNYKSFTQIVILGSASFTPFMQLPLGHRREIIEDILDIQIFTVMNSVLKDKTTEIKNQIIDIDTQIELGKTKVKMQQQYIATLENDKQKKVEDVQKRILETTAEISQLNASVKAERETESNLKSSISDAKEKRNKRTEMGSLLRKLSERITTQETQVQFYHDNDTCPTCSQSLDDEVKSGAIQSHTHKIEEIATAIESLNTQLTDIETRLAEIDSIEEKISEHQSNIITFNTGIIANQNYIQKLQSDLSTSSTESGDIEAEKIKLKTLAKEVVAHSDQKSKTSEEKHYLDIASVLLRDTGIKTKIIRQYLPVINKLVNKYLQAMDFFCHFELDETFNESIKSRHRDEFSYASFSEGEKQRIDLALLFTWRTIAKMKNCASTNLLLLDEVFDSSLDANGTDYVMNLINTLGEETNVFVISHKGDLLFDKFRSVIKFEKYQNFSRIQGI